MKLALQPPLQQLCFLRFWQMTIMLLAKPINASNLILRSLNVFCSPIWIIHAFSAQQQTAACSVSTVLFDCAFHGYEVAFAFVHSLSFNHEHAVYADCFGPVFRWKQGGMVEDAEVRDDLVRVLWRSCASQMGTSRGIQLRIESKQVSVDSDVFLRALLRCLCRRRCSRKLQVSTIQV